MNLCVVGRVLCFMHEFDEAIAYLEESVRINPSFAQAYFALGFALTVSGRAGDALAYLDRSVQLSPRDPHLSAVFATRAFAHLALGQYETAEWFARKSARIANANHRPLLMLAAILGVRGRIDDAGRAVKAALERTPGFTLTDARSEIFFCGDAALAERYLTGLRRAGLRESPPVRHERKAELAAAADD
jgi:tetratricopeptide (TPR) repeat protein